MNEDNNKWSTKLGELSRRAGKLSERGAHYFVGSVMGIGMLKPDLLAEFEKVLHRLETDPLLGYCWSDFDAAHRDEAPAAPTTLSASVAEPAASDAQSAFSVEVPPAPVFPDAGLEHARSGFVPIEIPAVPAIAPGPTGFFAKIFRRHRVAA